MWPMPIVHVAPQRQSGTKDNSDYQGAMEMTTVPKIGYDKKDQAAKNRSTYYKKTIKNLPKMRLAKMRSKSHDIKIHC